MYYNRKPAYRQRNRRPSENIDSRRFIKKADPAAIREDRQITTSSFNDFSLLDILKTNITGHGYTAPTPIQEQTIPHILNGKDVIGIANTGTGKTAAFILPLIHKLHLKSQEKAIIITPTRELALQILEEFKMFSKQMHIHASLCIGGDNIRQQEYDLRNNSRLVIGTPGRLKDLVNRRSLQLNQFRTVVLDEVDRMVDIGFIHDMRYLISFLPKERQSLFFSATVTGKVQTILREFVINPVTVSVARQETAANIDQDVIRVNNRDDKLRILQNLLLKKEFGKVLVFGRTKWGVEKLSKILVRNGFKAAAIHGNKSQGQRQRALQQFKQDQLQVLLATDVASRGLDIENVTHVINYDTPDSYSDYIHRIGRTGRANNKGIALTFVEGNNY